MKTVERLYLDNENEKLELKKENVNIDEAIISTLIDGFRLLCDPRRYSHDEFKKYAEKWNARATSPK